MMNNTQYANLCMRLLSISEWYLPIAPEVYQGVQDAYRPSIGRVCNIGIISKYTWKFLDTKNLKMSTFYTLPKVH